MILTLAEIKTQLRLELDFTEHDDLLTRLINAAQRSIERSYYCRLIDSDGSGHIADSVERVFVADDDIKLAAQMMVAQWYTNPTGTSSNSDSPADLGVTYLLFPLMEHTV